MSPRLQHGVDADGTRAHAHAHERKKNSYYDERTLHESTTRLWQVLVPPAPDPFCRPGVVGAALPLKVFSFSSTTSKHAHTLAGVGAVERVAKSIRTGAVERGAAPLFQSQRQTR